MALFRALLSDYPGEGPDTACGLLTIGPREWLLPPRQFQILDTLEWTVVARGRYGKAELPIDDIFVWDGPPRLVVITCGGDYDPATRSYSDNVVVYAEPA